MFSNRYAKIKIRLIKAVGYERALNKLQMPKSNIDALDKFLRVQIDKLEKKD